MLSMALATLFLPFLPLLPKQILLNNFLSDFPSVAISTDNVDAAQIERSQRWNLAELRYFMFVFGIASTLFDLLTFALLLHVFKAGEVTFQTGWFVVSLLTELVVVLVLRTRQPFYRSRPSALLLWATNRRRVVGLGASLHRGACHRVQFRAAVGGDSGRNDRHRRGLCHDH